MTSVSPVLTSVSPNINVVSPGMTPDLEDLGDNAVIENGQASAAFSGPYWPYAQHEHPVFTVMPHLANHIDRPCGWAGRNRYSDGNLTIAAPSQKGHDWQKNAIAIFQVHKEKFENASPVFAKMLNSDQCTFDPASKMYHIFLDENSKEVCYLLDAIYCEQREEPLSLRALDRHFIRDLWRTAAKCEMHMFATYASDMLM